MSAHILEDKASQGHRAPDGLRASTDMAEVVKHAELLLMVIPTPFVAATIKGIKDLLRPEQVCVLHDYLQTLSIALLCALTYL